MPEISEHFSHLEDLEVHELQARREELKNSAPEGNFENLDEESLAELLQITRLLRKKAAVGKRKAKASAVKNADTIDDIL